MPSEWMSLSKVAQMLGVHPSTVRNWSDQGVLPVHRTSGGHRRYLRSEVELWLESQRANQPADFQLVVQNALRNTRMQISEGALKDEPWYAKLDEEARVQYRLSGRALVQGLISYMHADGNKAAAEARALGYEYASRGRRYGLSVLEATHAFLFFRNNIIDSMLAIFESAAVNSPSAWGSMYRQVTTFTDLILLTILETYEAHEHSKQRVVR